MPAATCGMHTTFSISVPDFEVGLPYLDHICSSEAKPPHLGSNSDLAMCFTKDLRRLFAACGIPFSDIGKVWGSGESTLASASPMEWKASRGALQTTSRQADAGKQSIRCIDVSEYVIWLCCWWWWWSGIGVSKWQGNPVLDSAVS